MPFVRRSGRTNPNYTSPHQNQMKNPMFYGFTPQRNQNRPQYERREENHSKGQRYFNEPVVPADNQKNTEVMDQNPQEVPQPEIAKPEDQQAPPVNNEQPPPDESATTKALNKMEEDGTEKKKFRKTVKLPLAVRRKRLNTRLSKIIAPKSALMLLHELKPECTFKVQEQPGLSPVVFNAQVECGGVLLGTGQGVSKSQAKNSAAENVIKSLVSKTLSQSQSKKNETEGNSDEPMDESVSEDAFENLPWAGLASFAMYKLFTDWQGQGADLPIPRAPPKPKGNSPKNVAKKELPPDAAQQHPAVLLNMMNPGLTAVEVSREIGPKFKITMGYSVDGQMYTGTGGNKKEAKKEAAKAVLSSIYGVEYPA